MGEKAINKFLDKVVKAAHNDRTDEQNRTMIESNFWSLVEMGNFKAYGASPEREKHDQKEILEMIYKEYMDERYPQRH